MSDQVYIVCVTDEFLPTPINTKFASDLSMRYKNPTFFIRENQAENEAKRLNRLSRDNSYYVVPLEKFSK